MAQSYLAVKRSVSATKARTVCVITSVHSPFDVRIFHKECKSLVGAGLDVTLLAPHCRSETVEGVRVVALPRITRRLSRMTWGALVALRAGLRVNADIYHIHDPELIFAGVILAAKGKRVIYDVHEDAPRAILSRHYVPAALRRLVGGGAAVAIRLGSRAVTASICATPAIAKRVAVRGKCTLVVQNFPFVDEFAPTGQAWRGRETAVGYVGSITEARGILEMVKAMDLLAGRSGVRLELAGTFSPPELQAKVERLPGWKRVRYLGELSRSELAHLFPRVRAGLVVLRPEPNYLEAYATKMFEYMAAGLPVIASDFPLWRAIIEEAECGVLVDPLNPHAIAEAIEYIVTHDEEAAAMGRAGRNAVVRRYNWESQEPKLLGLYRDICEGLDKGARRL